jgi:ABC-type transporter Mla MlaB component
VAGLEDDDPFSLDFTSPNALPQAAPEQPKQSKPESKSVLKPAAEGESPPKPKLTLELEPFGSSMEDRSLSPSLSSAPLSVSVVSAPVFPLVRLEPLLEQAARAFAAGKAAETRQLLETAVQSGQANEAEAVWWLLFDVYRALGVQEGFDKLALEFAQRFEKSPPAWSLQPTAVEPMPGSGDAGRASVALTGKLNSRCAPQFSKLVSVASTRSMLRLDVSKIQEADAGGCQLLLDTILALKKTPCELVLGDAEHLAGMLKGKLQMMQRTNESMWLLLLELYQWLGLKDSFEEQAVGYAVTFEVSPPSWVELQRKAAVVMPAHEFSEISVDEERSTVLSLEGELLQADVSRFAAIGDSLAEGLPEDEIIVDLARLQRIDEASAMALRQALADVSQATSATAICRIRLTGCNHLVATLLEMAGVAELALIDRVCV